MRLGTQEPDPGANPANSNNGSQCSFDLSKLSVFVGGKESSGSEEKIESSVSEVRETEGFDVFDSHKKEPPAATTLKYIKNKMLKQLKSKSKIVGLENSEGSERNKNEIFCKFKESQRNLSFCHNSNNSYFSNDGIHRAYTMNNNSFSGGEVTLFKDLEVNPRNIVGTKNLQSAGSLRKRRATKGTLTTKTPESSVLNKSTENHIFHHSNSYVQGKDFGPALYDSGSPYKDTQLEDISYGSPLAIRGSNDALLYNYITNPIFEAPEIGGDSEGNYDLGEDSDRYYPPHHNFSFNESVGKDYLLENATNFRSKDNLKKARLPKPVKRKSFNKSISKINPLADNAKARKRNYMRIDQSKDFDVSLKENDRRTTLMIRNIPNKYTQKMLLEEIDEIFKGLYDFFYLPIDFDNKCNVGYAFINLVDPVHIQPFMEEYHSKKWRKFNSDKICSINYARIQGREEYTRHFKGSSVMKQKEKSLRPLIFSKEAKSIEQSEDCNQA